MKQETFTDIEHSFRKKKTKREEFLKSWTKSFPGTSGLVSSSPTIPFDAINRIIVQTGHMMKGGTIVDATIINAPSSTKNADKARDPEMHQAKN